MKIVLDSNILFSALIKDSFTRKLILEYDEKFLFPSYIVEEMNKYKDMLLKKSGMENHEFEALIVLLMKKIVVVDEHLLSNYKEEALEIVKDIDAKDALFVACALAYPGSVIWSNDEALKRQERIKIYNTEQISSII